MTSRLIIEPEAEADLQQAFAWYEEQHPGLGNDFLTGIDAAFAAVRRRPLSFARVRGEIRRAIVRRFPYGIFFVLDGKTIHVLAVLHAKRNPTIWKRRRTR